VNGNANECEQEKDISHEVQSCTPGCPNKHGISYHRVIHESGFKAIFVQRSFQTRIGGMAFDTSPYGLRLGQNIMGNQHAVIDSRMALDTTYFQEVIGLVGKP
jgi:hypothetical protein